MFETTGGAGRGWRMGDGGWGMGLKRVAAEFVTACRDSRGVKLRPAGELFIHPRTWPLPLAGH